MSKFRDHKTSLIGGEISPTAFGRTDLPQYRHACKTLRNMIPLVSGGAYRRPGTMHQHSYDATTDYAPALIPFVVSQREAYCLVIGEVISSSVGYIDAYRANSNNSSSSPATATVTGSAPWRSRLTSDADPVFTNYDYYDEWHQVQYTQSADVMYLVHPRYQPYTLTRTAIDAFTLTSYDAGLAGTAFRDNYPYSQQNSTATTLTINTASIGSGRTLTASTTGVFTGTSVDVGRVFKVFDGGTAYGCAIVTAAVNTTSATVTVKHTFGDTSAHLTWWESAWSDYRGWPRTVTLFEGRLHFGGNSAYPDTIWASQKDDYDQMSIDSDDDPFDPALSDSPFSVKLSSGQINQIQWMSSGLNLLVGTLGDEWILSAKESTSLGGLWTAKGGNISQIRQSAFGSSYHQSVRAGNEVFFVLNTDSEVKSLIFSDIEKSYVDESVQALYDEFPYSEFDTTLAWRRFRKFEWDSYRKTLWCVDSAGNIRGLTRDKRLGVNAWHSHELGGFNSEDTGGEIEPSPGVFATDSSYVVCSGSVISLTVVPNLLIGGSDLWLLVKRKIDDDFFYHLERIVGGPHRYNSAYVLYGPENTFFTDSSVFDVNVIAFPTIADGLFTGLDHLEGEEVSGTVINERGIFAVTGSEVNGSGYSQINMYASVGLDDVESVVVMGLPFSSTIEPVRIEAGSQIGSSQGAMKRIHKVVPRFYRTNYCRIGRDADNLETIEFRDGSTPMTSSAELYTGDKVIDFNGEYDQDGFVYILHDKPLPFALVSVTAEGLEYDGGYNSGYNSG